MGVARANGMREENLCGYPYQPLSLLSLNGGHYQGRPSGSGSLIPSRLIPTNDMGVFKSVRALLICCRYFH